jgi:hypothetical protein
MLQHFFQEKRIPADGAEHTITQSFLAFTDAGQPGYHFPDAVFRQRIKRDDFTVFSAPRAVSHPADGVSGYFVRAKAAA